MRPRACFLALLVLVMSIGLAGMKSQVTAQDVGLSTEQLEWVNRYFEGLEKRSSYSAYVQTEQDFQNQALVFSSTGLPEFVNSTMQRQETSTIIQTESPEIRSEITLNISQDQDYSLEAEVRIVDGILYVNAAYVGRSLNLPPLPEGWIVVDDSIEWEGLNPLQLNSYVDNRVSPLQDQELLLDGLSNVTLEHEKLAANTSADVVVMTLTDETVAGLLTPSATSVGSDILDAILENMLDDSAASIRVYLDKDGHIVRMGTHIRLLSEVNLDQIEDIPFPAGTTLTFDGTFDNTTTYTQINDTTLMPMGAPELDDVAQN